MDCTAPTRTLTKSGLGRPYWPEDLLFRSGQGEHQLLRAKPRANDFARRVSRPDKSLLRFLLSQRSHDKSLTSRNKIGYCASTFENSG